MKLGGVGGATVYDDKDGLVKLVVDAEYGEILGAHIVGNRACDMIAELVATMALEGGYQELARIVHPHPTISEAILDAARAVDGWAIHASDGTPREAPRESRLLLRPRLALRLPGRGADQRPLHRRRAGAAGVAADPARRPVPALRPRLVGATGPARAEGMAEVERRAAAYGLPPIVWPDPWPGNTLFAMRAATFAKQTGRTVSFALAAFRQAFAAGRDLGDPDNVLIAAAACELHPSALLKAAGPRRSRGRCARRPSGGRSWACSASRRWSSATRSSGATTRLEEAVGAAS